MTVLLAEMSVIITQQLLLLSINIIESILLLFVAKVSTYHDEN